MKLLGLTCNIVPNKMLQLQQCSSPCILLSIQLEIKNNVHEIKESIGKLSSLVGALQIHEVMLNSNLVIKIGTNANSLLER